MARFGRSRNIGVIIDDRRCIDHSLDEYDKKLKRKTHMTTRWYTVVVTHFWNKKIKKKIIVIIAISYPLLDGSGARGRQHQAEAQYQRGRSDQGVIFFDGSVDRLRRFLRTRVDDTLCGRYRCRVVSRHDCLERFGRHNNDIIVSLKRAFFLRT